MAREVYVNLGGEERRLMFDAARSAIEIENRLKKVPAAVMDEQLRATRDNPAFSPIALAFLLWLGLRHADRKLSEAQVIDWMGAAFQENRGIELAWNVRDALFLSGVCGFSVDVQADDTDKAQEQDGAGDGGKAVRPSEEP